MPVNNAKNHYLGKEGLVKLNCAQAIISTFQDKFNLKQDLVGVFEANGRGKAPGGLCGAYYAAQYILKQQDAREQLSALEEYFRGQAGALECQEIRRAKQLSCVGCVEKSAEFLARV